MDVSHEVEEAMGYQDEKLIGQRHTPDIGLPSGGINTQGNITHNIRPTIYGFTHTE